MSLHVDLLSLCWSELDDDDDESTDGESEVATRESRARPDYHQSPWWHMYIIDLECRVPGTAAYRTFRRRFGVSFPRFREYVDAARSWRIFSEEPDALLRPPVPLELKVLGALRMVAKGCAFDAIAELSSMHISTMQAFFHAFWARFVLHFKSDWIKYPRSSEEAASVLRTFERAGFPGAVGSLDVTHVRWARCPARLANTYTGKEKVPTIAYEVVVDHNVRFASSAPLYLSFPTSSPFPHFQRKIMYVSRGFPGSSSDKEIVKTDDFVQEVKRRDILYDDVTYTLKGADGADHVWRGVYFITDNGYAKWRIMQAPLKHCRTYDEYKWSTRLESMRKDIECTFGVLKVRFRILSSSIRMQYQAYVDNIFVAACIMHNMLLVEDGLDEDLVFQSEDDDDLRAGIEARRIRLNRQGRRDVPQVAPRLVHHHAIDFNEDDDIDDTHFLLRDALIAHYMYTRPGWLVRANT